jgi:hypothetical protein
MQGQTQDTVEDQTIDFPNSDVKRYFVCIELGWAICIIKTAVVLSHTHSLFFFFFFPHSAD